MDVLCINKIFMSTPLTWKLCFLDSLQGFSFSVSLSLPFSFDFPSFLSFLPSLPSFPSFPSLDSLSLVFFSFSFLGFLTFGGGLGLGGLPLQHALSKEIH